MLVYIIPAISVGSSLIVWLKYGRDAQGKGLILTEYEPPTNLSPAEIGVLHDYKATSREVTAKLVDLALRKHIAIRRHSKKRLFSTHQVYEFELINDDVLELRNHEKALLNGLFGVVGVKFTADMQARINNPIAKNKALTQYPADTVSLLGQRITIDTVKPYFYQHVEEAKKNMYNSLTSAGYFKNNPLSSGLDFIFVAIFCLVAAIIYRNDYLYSFLLSSGIFLFFGSLMKARSPKGQRAKEEVEGFLLFLRLTEQEKVVAMQGPETEWTQKLDDAYALDTPTIVGLAFSDITGIGDSVGAVPDALSAS